MPVIRARRTLIGAIPPARAGCCAQPGAPSRPVPRADPSVPPSPAPSGPSRPTATGAGRRPRTWAGARTRRCRGIVPARLPDQGRDLRHRELSRGGDVEVLVLGGGGSHCRHDPVGDVVDVGQGSRLTTVAEDLERALVRERLRDQVRDGVGDSRLVGIGQLARPVGIERAADRVAQAVLVVGRARVYLAGELREAVGRAGIGQSSRWRSGVGYSVARSNTIDEDTYTSRATSARSRR